MRLNLNKYIVLAKVFDLLEMTFDGYAKEGL